MHQLVRQGGGPSVSHVAVKQVGGDTNLIAAVSSHPVQSNSKYL